MLKAHWQLLLLTVLVVALQPTTAWATGPRIAIRVVAIVAYLPLVMAFRLYSRDDLRAGLDAARIWIKRFRGSDAG